ncbi:hypothetical protein [Rickettsiella endosymbiont of Dermanyssus gallinae]|uniref:phage nozzle protein n=1 Tax=Rickettsiella endosymbiont of Dermanyssus gallinae TaxID=2856608 RepID=UPI001C533ADB|nr:hypothetical protein [Rickettsiella endosymbiont of Dermanyssus gallinae]
MTAIEGSYVSLLQGVSQQTPQLRIDGQAEAQINMLSDPTTSLRRRPGLPNTAGFILSTVSATGLYSIYLPRFGTESSESSSHLYIDAISGTYWVLNKDFRTKYTGSHTYLVGKSNLSIQTTALKDKVFILNTEQPIGKESNPGSLNPSRNGFFFVKASAFSKDYKLHIEATGITPVTVQYKTPSGSDSKDGALSSIDNVAAELEKAINALKIPNITVVRDGPYVAIAADTDDLRITTTSGSSFIGVSGLNNTNSIEDLPANLPKILDGYIISVGTDPENLAYFKFNYASTTWLETAKYGSTSRLSNMPLYLDVDGLHEGDYAGLLSGDSHNNDDPGFVKNGYITGISTYQGRLVFLSGCYVSMSNSTDPFRFYRSSVIALLPSDRIDLGIGSSQNTTLRQGIQFNKDLIVFGDNLQAVVSAGNSILTPQNASVSITSSLNCTSQIPGGLIGQTILYPFKRDMNYSGFLELVPSEYTNSQYISQDATQHLPEFFEGDIRFIVSSSTMNIAIASGSNPKDLYVYEYLWSSDGKQQNSWSLWRFKTDVISAYFAGEELIILSKVMFSTAPGFIVSRINPRARNAIFLDLWTRIPLKGGSAILPKMLLDYASHLALIGLPGDNNTYATEPVAIRIKDDRLYADIPDGAYQVGIGYESTYTLTPVILKDQNNKEVGTSKVRLVRLAASIYSIGEMYCRVKDTRTGVDIRYKQTGLIMNSTDLKLNKALVSKGNNVQFPCRTIADSTYVTFSVVGNHDMNIVNVWYLLSYYPRSARI